MAVSVFTNSGCDEYNSVTGLSAFTTWAQARALEPGNFLSGAIIDKTTDGDFDTVTIAKGGDVFYLRVQNASIRYSQYSTLVGWIDPDSSGSKPQTFEPYNGGSAGYRWIALKNAYLCKNGIIFRFIYRTRSNDYGGGTNYYSNAVLTLDEKNKLVFGRVEPQLGQGSDSPTQPNSFYVSNKESIATYFKPTPWAQQVHTNIHQVNLSKEDGSPVKVPNLFVADATQCTTSNYTDVYTTALGGVVYMTNGVWYVKDE